MVRGCLIYPSTIFHLNNSLSPWSFSIHKYLYFFPSWGEKQLEDVWHRAEKELNVTGLSSPGVSCHPSLMYFPSILTSLLSGDYQCFRCLTPALPCLCCDTEEVGGLRSETSSSKLACTGVEYFYTGWIGSGGVETVSDLVCCIKLEHKVVSKWLEKGKLSSLLQGKRENSSPKKHDIMEVILEDDIHRLGWQLVKCVGLALSSHHSSSGMDGHSKWWTERGGGCYHKLFGYLLT